MFPDLTRDDVFRLETRRLWLHWPRAADVPALLRLAGEKAVAEMTARIPHPLAEEDATDFVLDSRRANMEGQALVMAIAPHAQPRSLIGVVEIRAGEEAGRPRLGYWLGRPHWGEGLATEAAQAMVDAFFAYTAGGELTAAARIPNPASRRVLEKCGFSPAGTGLMPFPARGAVLPVERFRLDRRGWRSFEDRSTMAFVPRLGPGQAALHP